MEAKDRIKYYMREKNITEYKLAKLSGLSQSTISNIFLRNTSPTIPTVEAICSGLGITMSQFFAGPDEKNVHLTDEEFQTFCKWMTLTQKQKSVIKELIEVLNSEN